MSDFRESLPAREAHARLQQSLAALREAEKNAVLWFAEILRRRLYRELGYSSIHQYAGEGLGFSPSKTSQFIGLAESLERLPALKTSVAAGELSWTKAREVAKVATARSEGAWIALARQSSRRELEAKITAARKAVRSAATAAQESLLPATGAALATGSGSLPSSQPTSGGPISPCAGPAASTPQQPTVEIPVILSYRLGPEQAARLDTLVERIHKLRSRRGAPSRGRSREEMLLEAFAALEESEEALAAKVKQTIPPARGKANWLHRRHAESRRQAAPSCASERAILPG